MKADNLAGVICGDGVTFDVTAGGAPCAGDHSGEVTVRLDLPVDCLEGEGATTGVDRPGDVLRVLVGKVEVVRVAVSFLVALP